MVVLDTDILVAILRGNEEARDYVENLNDWDIKTTVINEFELFNGAFRHPKKEEKLAQVENLLSSLDVLNLDPIASKYASLTLSNLMQIGRPIDVMGLFIGIITSTNSEKLITRNIKHFENIPGIRLESW